MFVRSSVVPSQRRDLLSWPRRAALLIGLILLLAPAAQAQSPAVAVTPDSGVAGAGLTVTGSDWTPGDTVDVQIGNQLVCQLVADSNSNLNGNQANDGCEVPAGLSAGSHPVTATDEGNGAEAQSAASFEILVAASFTATSPVELGSETAFNAAGSTTSSGQPTSYSWNFGDGTSGSGEMPSHTYAAAGVYTVTLVVSDSSGDVAQKTRQVIVEGPPTAQLSASPGGPIPTGTPIQFDASASTDPFGTITSYQWNFGDGQSSIGPSPTHAYSTAGDYTVALTVTDAAGATNTITDAVTVTDRPPIAAFNPTSATVLAGSSIPFDGTQSSDPDGSITGYAWSFGDGSASTSPQPSHTYMQTGTFTVTLAVTDNSGNASTITHSITVIAPPPLQTLVLTPVADPALVTWAPVSTSRSGRVDLGQRLFCPGLGPSCTARITTTSNTLGRSTSGTRTGRSPQPRATAAGSRVIRLSPNSSAELALKLSRRAVAALTRDGRLRVRVKVVIVRGDLTTTNVITRTLR